MQRAKLFSRAATISLCTYCKNTLILVLCVCIRLSKTTSIISNEHEDLKHTC